MAIIIYIIINNLSTKCFPCFIKMCKLLHKLS